MPEIESIISVILDGEPPPGSSLPSLSGCRASCELIDSALRPFSRAARNPIRIERLADLKGIVPKTGTVVIYLVGHGWTNDRGQLTVSVRDENCSALLDGSELIEVLNRCIDSDSRVILLVDTCAAAALSSDLKFLACRDVTAVFASERDEHAWNLLPDGTTRFAFEVSQALAVFGRRRQAFDIVELSTTVKKKIEQNCIGYHQTVTYRVKGDEISLSSLSRERLAQRPFKTYQRLRNRLIVIGGSIVAAAFGGAIYWHNHVFVTVVLGELSRIADAPAINVYRADPDQNRLVLVKRVPAGGERSIRLFLPADNLLIAVDATYKDGKVREIRFHTKFQAGLTTNKRRLVVLPSADEITLRPSMAYVSADFWLKGNPPTEQPALEPFWIDVAPPTIEEYLPFIYDTYKSHTIEAYESVLIWQLMDKADLSDDDFRLSESPLGLVKKVKGNDSLFAYPTCPAPMTEREARLYVASVNKKLPSRDQWELAVRGIDGRTYPWGNRLDEARVNAGLPRPKGWERRARLRPVDEHPEAVSPFGLIDTVGNAGDWVDEPSSRLERHSVLGAGFMGGVFQFNAQDCTAYSFTRLPTTVAESLAPGGFWMITCRGVIPAK